MELKSSGNRLHIIGLTALVAVAAALPAHDATAASATAIKSHATGNCLAAATTLPGARVIQTACTGEAIQLWESEYIGGDTRLRNKQTGLCMAVSGGSLSGGAVVLQENCSMATSQFWLKFTDNTVRSKNSGLCLALSLNGMTTEQRNCASVNDQKWTVSF